MGLGRNELVGMVFGFLFGALLLGVFLSEPSHCFQYGHAKSPEQAAHRQDAAPKSPGGGDNVKAAVEAQDAHQKCHPYWGPEWLLVWVTIGLVIVTAALAWFTAYLYWTTRSLADGAQKSAITQSRDMRRSMFIAIHSAKASRIAANAARASVELAEKTAARNEEIRERLERARVSGGGIRMMQMVPGTIGGNMVIPTNNFEIHINNHGRGPAVLRRIRWGFCSAEKAKMPPEPNYDAGDIPFADSIGPGSQGKLTKIVEITNPTVLQAIVVRFDYYDVFLQRDDWAGFVLEITPGAQLPIPIDAPKGYVRVT